MTFFSMLYGSLIAASGLDGAAFPVQIIDLQLYKFHLRMARKDLIQKIGGIMVGKSCLYSFSSLFLILQEIQIPYIFQQFHNVFH